MTAAASISAPGGFILAGGRSSRMGQDKSLLPVDGGSLVERISNVLSGLVVSVGIVGGSEAHRQRGMRVIADDFPGYGPVGGILTALRSSRSEWNLVVACDMPALTVGFLKELMASRTEDVACVVPRTPDGRMHPLCALYHRSAKPVFESEILRGTRKLTQVVQLLPFREVLAGDASVLQNLNTPQDWQCFRRGSQTVA